MDIRALERCEMVARGAYTAGYGEGCPALRAIADGFDADRRRSGWQSGRINRRDYFTEDNEPIGTGCELKRGAV